MSAHHTAVEATAPPHAHDQARPAWRAAGSDPGEARRPWTVFALMIAAQFMVILDVSVVNVALPSIGHGLRLTASDYQWVISAYVLMSGGLLLLGGRVADLFDRRRAFLAGITTFTAASLVSGFAQTPLTLIASRAAQGAGAALLTPAALSIIMTAYAGRQRQTALAVWGAIGNALVPPAAWRIRSLVSASAVMAGVTGVVVGAIFLSSLYLQRVTGASPVQAGLEFLPLAAAITLAAAGASKVTGKLGPRTMIASGLLVMTSGVLLLAASARGGSYAADVLPGFLLVGAGVGPMFVAIAIAAMSRVPEEQSGLASGLLMTGHEIGAALGVAALTAVAGTFAIRSGLVAGYANAFHVTAAALAGLFLLTLLAVPNDKPQHGGHSPH